MEWLKWILLFSAMSTVWYNKEPVLCGLLPLNAPAILMVSMAVSHFVFVCRWPCCLCLRIGAHWVYIFPEIITNICMDLHLHIYIFKTNFPSTKIRTTQIRIIICPSFSALDTPIPDKALLHNSSSVNSVKRWLCVQTSVLSVRPLQPSMSYLTQVSKSRPWRGCCTCIELSKRSGVEGACILDVSCWGLLALCLVISPRICDRKVFSNPACCVFSLAGEAVWSFALEWCLFLDAWWFNW